MAGIKLVVEIMTLVKVVLSVLINKYSNASSIWTAL